MATFEKIVSLKSAPTNKYVIWLDTSSDPAIMKTYIQGKGWVPTSKDAIEDLKIEVLEGKVSVLETKIADAGKPVYTLKLTKITTEGEGALDISKYNELVQAWDDNRPIQVLWVSSATASTGDVYQLIGKYTSSFYFASIDKWNDMQLGRILVDKLANNGYYRFATNKPGSSLDTVFDVLTFNSEKTLDESFSNKDTGSVVLKIESSPNKTLTVNYTIQDLELEHQSYLLLKFHKLLGVSVNLGSIFVYESEGGFSTEVAKDMTYQYYIKFELYNRTLLSGNTPSGDYKVSFYKTHIGESTQFFGSTFLFAANSSNYIPTSDWGFSFDDGTVILDVDMSDLGDLPGGCFNYFSCEEVYNDINVYEKNPDNFNTKVINISDVKALSDRISTLVVGDAPYKNNLTIKFTNETSTVNANIPYDELYIIPNYENTAVLCGNINQANIGDCLVTGLIIPNTSYNMPASTFILGRKEEHNVVSSLRLVVNNASENATVSLYNEDEGSEIDSEVVVLSTTDSTYVDLSTISLNEDYTGYVVNPEGRKSFLVDYPTSANIFSIGISKPTVKTTVQLLYNDGLSISGNATHDLLDEFKNEIVDLLN